MEKLTEMEIEDISGAMGGRGAAHAIPKNECNEAIMNGMVAGGISGLSGGLGGLFFGAIGGAIGGAMYACR